MDNHARARFCLLGTVTIVAVYLVILAGGIVRASGAGMGCPDWPTCFGQWIPPTDVAQLPANYQEIYAQRGYRDTEFNPVKTWTEYVNRLLGASAGLLVLLTAWSSRAYWRTDKAICQLAVGCLLLIGFQAWLGSAVVASNLRPLMITLHMLMALLIVALLILTVARSQRPLFGQWPPVALPARFRLVLQVAMAMTLLQVAMGTQVREAVDFLANEHSYIERRFWRDDFPMIFYLHRSFSSLILFTNLWLAWQLHRHRQNPPLLRRLGVALAAVVVTAILAGVSLDRLGMPPVAQPVHLLMASLIFGLQCLLSISLHYAGAFNLAGRPNPGSV